MNFVYYTSASGLPATATTPIPYFMPNGIGDTNTDTFTTDGNGFAYVLRTTPPVAGRWGEAQSVAGGFLNPAYTVGGGVPQYLNTVSTGYSNQVKAGYSLDVSDIVNGLPRDAADDNFNSFDPWSPGHTGEVGDVDMYDAVGRCSCPSIACGAGRPRPTSTARAGCNSGK